MWSVVSLNPAVTVLIALAIYLYVRAVRVLAAPRVRGPAPASRPLGTAGSP